MGAGVASFWDRVVSSIVSKTGSKGSRSLTATLTSDVSGAMELASVISTMASSVAWVVVEPVVISPDGQIVSVPHFLYCWYLNGLSSVLPTDLVT